jgi:hypothetical protein
MSNGGKHSPEECVKNTATTATTGSGAGEEEGEEEEEGAGAGEEITMYNDCSFTYHISILYLQITMYNALPQNRSDPIILRRARSRFMTILPLWSRRTVPCSVNASFVPSVTYLSKYTRK